MPPPTLPAAPQFPVEQPAPGPTVAAPPGDALADPRAAQRWFESQMAQLLGRSPLLGWLQLDDFARRVVATVDNLPSKHVAPLIWPVAPTPGQLMVDPSEGRSVLADANAQRYEPLVRALSAVDTGLALTIYRSAYPLFQTAYEDLGYPGRYFNDRLVQVIDHLLATPEPTGPLAVVLPPINAAVESNSPQRPWVRYEFADPRLENLSAGQKTLLRMGTANRTALKAKLREWRAAVTASAPPRP